MEIKQWNPRREYTKEEEWLLKRVRRHRKLFAFLREHRQELFDKGFEAELAAMYRETGAGKEPVTPALMAMAVLLQEYAGVSDAEAVELSVVDKRWQLVLDRLGETTPAFSQGAFWDFRERLIRTQVDRRLLERTRELAKQCAGFDWKKLPFALRVAIDSSPLLGAGRVEDTINLLGHAARTLVVQAATLTGRTYEEVAQDAGIPLVLETSIKAGLDLCWDNPGALTEALGRLTEQLDSLQRWIARQVKRVDIDMLQRRLETLARIRAQNLEPEPAEPTHVRIRQGTAEDRLISIEDPEMRHGRKSQTRRFDGYKRHIAVEMDTGLIVACALTPANHPEALAAESIEADLVTQGLTIGTLHIDRGYLGSSVVANVLARHGELVCRPWPVANNNGLFAKTDFDINVKDNIITCPNGQSMPLQFGQTVAFDAEVCAPCPLRSQCTTAKPDRGRTVRIAHDERLQKRLRKQVATTRGRQKLRERVVVEHKLAHISQRQGNRARYRGVRKNLFDLRRAATIQNLEVIQRVDTEFRNAA